MAITSVLTLLIKAYSFLVLYINAMQCKAWYNQVFTAIANKTLSGSAFYFVDHTGMSQYQGCE